MHETSMPFVSIVISTHNRKLKLERLIRSILASDYPSDRIEIIVVDDASTDGTYEYVKKKFPQVKTIRNKKEKLVAEARNEGIRVSRGEYILVIDDDNVVDPAMIKELVNYMENNPQVGVAAPLMYFLSDPKRIWCAGVRRNYWTTITKLIGFNTIDKGSYKEPYESEDFPNAFMIRREVINKVGLFNSRLFPIHYEEADFCQRVRRAGYKIMLVPTAKIWHDIPLPETNRSKMLHIKTPLRAYYVARNRILFHKIYSKNVLQKMISLFFASSIILFYYLPLVMLSRNINKGKIIIELLKGLIDGFRMRLR